METVFLLAQHSPNLRFCPLINRADDRLLPIALLVSLIIASIGIIAIFSKRKQRKKTAFFLVLVFVLGLALLFFVKKRNVGCGYGQFLPEPLDSILVFTLLGAGLGLTLSLFFKNKKP